MGSQNTATRKSRDCLFQQFEAFDGELGLQRNNPGNVPPGVAQALHQASSHRVLVDTHDNDRNRRSGSGHGAQGWFGAYSDYVHRQAHQFLRQPPQLVYSSVGVAVIYLDVLTVDVPELPQAISKVRRHGIAGASGDGENAHDRDSLWGLRRRGRRAEMECDEEEQQRNDTNHRLTFTHGATRPPRICDGRRDPNAAHSHAIQRSALMPCAAKRSTGEPLSGSSSCLGSLVSSIPRWSVCRKRAQKISGNGRYLVDGGKKWGLVGFRWLVEAAQLSHELQRG